jgi:hypothetical protein
MIECLERPRPRHHRKVLAGVCGAALALTVLASLGGCGGGGEAGSCCTGHSTPSSVAIGRITGVGSIVVAGVHYDETQARIVDDDDLPLSPVVLKLGVMTSIQAGLVSQVAGARTAAAKTIRVGEQLIGPLSNLDEFACTIEVLGQRVAANASTAVDSSLPTVSGPCRLAAMLPGTVVAVHGEWDLAQSRLVATRLEARPAASPYLLRATVQAYSPAARTISMRDQIISLADVPSLPDSMALGSFARVKLRSVPVNGRWVAFALGDATPKIDAAEQVELEGRISQFGSVGQFSVNGLHVDASSASFPNGQAGIALGGKVAVEGRATGGVLEASRVNVEASNDFIAEPVSVQGRIVLLNHANQSFLVRGTTVSFAQSPAYKNGSASLLAVERVVKVIGVLSADGAMVVAQAIEFGI